MKSFRILIPISIILLTGLFLVACSNTKQTDLQRIDENGYDMRKTLY